MSPFVRAAVVLLVAAPAAPAATPEQIDAAIAKGVAALKSRFANGAGGGEAATHGTGPAALAGIAILEAKTPAGDPAVKAIAAAVRQQAYREFQTYQISLSLIFLDRLEDPADVPLIQLLGVRLLVGQTGRGGWGYNAVGPIQAAEEQRLRADLKGAELTTAKDGSKGGVPKLAPVVLDYLNSVRSRTTPQPTDDNSNTQFGTLALWTARKYGVPADAGLDLVERRFLGSQDAAGGWAYTPDAATGGYPAMTCAGLLAVATAIGRREERRVKTEPPPKADGGGKSGDPFFNPPPRPEGKGAAGPKRPADARDAAAARGFAFLGAALARGGAGGGGMHGDTRNLYFLWSLERVGVIYGVDKIGGVDWFEHGADHLIRTQDAAGTWSAGGHGADVDTSFAVLFLLKANIARDLSNRVRGESGSELRAGTAAPAPPTAGPAPKGPTAPANPLPVPAAAPLPAGAAGTVAADLLKAADGPGLARALDAARDGKGPEFTTGLVAAVHRLDGDRKKQARDALAERLSRMSADTLRGMMANADAELRRGAVLGAAMRDDKGHVPDLIERLTDADELVVRAARAGLRSLTEQDFGPQPGASAADRTRAAAAWRAWWARQKR